MLVTSRYTDFSSDQDIIRNKALIDKVGERVEPHLLASILHNVVMRSAETEAAYFNDYLSLFKNQNNSDFDDMLFGYMKLAYHNFKKPESKALAKSLIREKINQYHTMKYINKHDQYTDVAVDSLHDLMEEIQLRD